MAGGSNRDIDSLSLGQYTTGVVDSASLLYVPSNTRKLIGRWTCKYRPGTLFFFFFCLVFILFGAGVRIHLFYILTTRHM